MTFVASLYIRLSVNLKKGMILLDIVDIMDRTVINNAITFISGAFFMQKVEMKKTDETVEFALGDMQSIIMAFVMISIIAVVGLTLTADLKADINETESPDAFAAAGEGIDAIGVITGKLGLIALIVVFALIIGILYRYFNQ